MPSQTPSTQCTPSAASRIDPRMAILTIGPTRYSLNRCMLSLHSTVLRNLLANDPESRILFCPDRWDVGAFDVFIDWMYTQRLPSTYRPMGTSPAQPIDGDACVRIYIFAREIGAWGLLSALWSRMTFEFAQSGYYAPFDTVNLVFASLPLEHLVLDLLVEAHVRSWRDDAQGNWELQQVDRLPEEFVLRVTRGKVETRRKELQRI